MNVDENVINEIITQLKKHDGVEKAVLFGSRARGDNSERSDYDIAVYGNVSLSSQYELRHYCSEVIRTLHKIDLIFISKNTYPKLLERIEEEGIVLYELARR